MQELCLFNFGEFQEFIYLFVSVQDRHLNLVRKDSHSTEDIVTLMLHQRCSIEKAMALDFSRQSKVKISVSLSLFLSLSYLIWRIYRYLYTFQINELKLLVLQQQSYIQKLELQNKEMDMVLQGLLFPADEVRCILVNNQMKMRFIWHLGIITHHNCTEYYE